MKTRVAELMNPIQPRGMGIYERHIKRALDVACASVGILLCCPIYIIIAMLVRKNLGKPILFIQERPGLIGNDGKERLFKMYKFTTMTDKKDEKGELLPDESRLTPFGKQLRATSLDELPELFNILNGTMSFIGPRPQLVRDMVFMTDDQRKRHTVKPGLSGLAQVKGRNAISWDDKFKWDLNYIESISFRKDVEIFMETVRKVFIKKGSQDTAKEVEIAPDYGDDLLLRGCISKEEYDALQKKACLILGERVD